MTCPGYGNVNAKVMFIGDVPGVSETNERKSLIAGASGQVLERIFEDIGLPQYDTQFYFTTVYKNTPPRNDISKIKDVCIMQREEDKLWNEIREVSPNVIVTLGEIAFKVVTGLKNLLNHRGSILPNEKFGYLPKVIPTIHPLNLTRAANASGDHFEDKKIYNGIWRNIVQLDFIRAIEESKTRDFHGTERNLRVATSSLDVMRLIAQNKGKDRVFVDVETYKSTLCSCIGIGFDDYEALSIPLFQQVGDIKLCSIPHSDLARIWQELQILFSRMPIAGQNLKFDQAKLELLGFSFPMGVKSDVMLKAHTVNPELPSKGLAFLTSIYTREPYYKDEGSEFNPKYHKIERLFLYNAKDVVITADIDFALEKELDELGQEFHTDLKSFYYDFVISQHQFYSDMEKVGFCVDEGRLHYLQVKYETWRDILQLRLNAAAQRNININSPKQVKEFIYHDLNIPVIDKYKIKSDEDTIARLLKNNVKNEAKRSVLNDILEFRRVSKTLSTYLLCQRDYDGKMRSQYRIIGTETGRSSTSILDEPVRPESMGFAFQTLTKHGDIGQDIRSYLIPNPGYVFVNIDLSQAEARVVALLSKDYDLLAAFDEIDIHRRTAWLVLVSGILDLSRGKHDSDEIGKDSAERFMGKKVRHAGNYDMGWREFMGNVISDCRRFGIDFTISKFKAEQLLERFHAANPKIKSVFHAEIKECIDTRRALVTPYGRVRKFFDRYSERLYKEAYADIPQDTVKQRLTRAGIKMTKLYPELKKSICGESHDALVMQLPITEYVDICKEFKKVMEEPIDFSHCSLPRGQLIIPCDFEIGENYKDFKKLKLNELDIVTK